MFFALKWFQGHQLNDSKEQKRGGDYMHSGKLTCRWLENPQCQDGIYQEKCEFSIAIMLVYRCVVTQVETFVFWESPKTDFAGDFEGHFSPTNHKRKTSKSFLPSNLARLADLSERKTWISTRLNGGSSIFLFGKQKSMILVESNRFLRVLFQQQALSFSNFCVFRLGKFSPWHLGWWCFDLWPFQRRS